MRAVNEKFADLGTPRRIWAVAAIHGEGDKLVALHDYLATRFATRDRLVYLGNYLAPGARDNASIFSELLAFRSALLTKPGMEPGDIVYLRGPAEEAWQRLLRLQFAPVPLQTLDRLLAAGVEAYLHFYGGSLVETRTITRAGSVAITRWTNQLRAEQRRQDGYEFLTSSMKRAAFTRPEKESGKRVLFVPAGFDPSRSLEDQGDGLWYETGAFQMTGSAMGFSRLVRGFDSARGGLQTDRSTVTLDGGSGFGGPLVCGCFNVTGRLTEVISIGGQGTVESIDYSAKPDPSPSHEHEDDHVVLHQASLFPEFEQEFRLAASPA